MVRDHIRRWSRLLARLLFFPAVCLVIWGQLRHVPQTPSIPNLDKLMHFTAYFGLAGLGTVALDGKRKTLLVVLALILLGGAMEILQSLTGRDAELLDEVANTAGVLLGLSAGVVWAMLTGARPAKLAALSHGR